jgi:hypothetical protein
MRLKIGSPEVVSHLIVIVVVGLGLWIGRSWPYETGLFPRATGYTIILVAIVSLFLEIRRKMRQTENAGAPPVIEADLAKKALVSFGWLAGFIAGIWILGYVLASLLYVFFYMKVKGKQSWLITILITVGAYVFMWSIFGLLLGIKWFPGALWGWLGL